MPQSRTGFAFVCLLKRNKRKQSNLLSFHCFLLVFVPQTDTYFVIVSACVSVCLSVCVLLSSFSFSTHHLTALSSIFPVLFSYFVFLLSQKRTLLRDTLILPFPKDLIFFVFFSFSLTKIRTRRH